MLEGVLRDVRFGIRMLGRNPGFTTVAALSLALGIGANTTIFTLINAVRLKLLPVTDPSRLVMLRWDAPDRTPTPARSIWGSNRREGGRHTGTSFSYPAFLKIRDRNDVFSDIFAFATLGQVTISADGQPGLAQSVVVTAGTFETLGLRPALGRSIQPEDDRAGAPPVAMISDGYWQRRFGADPAILNRSINVNGTPVAIVGVAPAGFTGWNPGTADDLWFPMAAMRVLASERVRNGAAFSQNDFWWVLMMARLKPGVSEAGARANVETIFKQTAMDDIVVTGKPPVIPEVTLDPGGQGLDYLRRQLETPLSIMMVVVFLVALIACANVANLLLARAAVRQKEIAVRLSLGTSRFRLVRQLLTESALLAGLGAVLGLGLASFGSRALVGFLGRDDRPMVLDLSPDLTVLGFTALAGLLTTLVFGLAPAVRATAIEPFATLRESSTGGGGAHGLRLARFLIVSQVAVSLVLLTGSALFVRTLQNLHGVEVGFDRSDLLLFGINAKQAGSSGLDLADQYDRIQAEINRIPGVRSSTFTPFPLLSGSAAIFGVKVPGYIPQPDERMEARGLQVGDNFFETLGLDVILGRAFDARDREGAPLVAVANRAFVRKYLGEGSPLGRTFTFGSEEDPLVRIVGVATDARYDQLRGDVEPTLYTPFRQAPFPLESINFEVKTARDPLTLVPDVRKAVEAVNAGLPLYGIKTQDGQIEQLLLPERMFASLTTFFGVLALALVCVGLYGIISYGVNVRTAEIGLRMALGAGGRDIVRMILGDTFSLVAKGVLLGVPAALAAGYFAKSVVAGLLFGIKPTDVPSLVFSAAVMIAVGGLAGALPARKASEVDPMQALRCE